MDTTKEDLLLLRYRGREHNFIGIVGLPGQRRFLCEYNRMSRVQLRTDDPTLTVYNQRKETWVRCLDRRDKD